MQFYTAFNEPRPVRLSDEIRQWAWDSLHGQYGDEAVKNWAVAMDDIPGFAELTPLKQHDLALRRIAGQAPVRICPHERVSGAATLGLSIYHKIPATFGGKELFYSVSHLTPNYRRAMTEGMDSYAAQIRTRLTDPQLSGDDRAFLQSLDNAVDCMRIWHARYLAAAPEEIRALLRQVPFGPARNFREAVQSLWFLFAFMRLCGNWPGIGRIDVLLGDYLKNDLASGAVTLDEAREVLASMFIKGCEWIIADRAPDSGDAQHYQNIVLGGVDENGVEVTNEVTYLVLDIVEELAISDFPITVRLNAHTPERLLRRIAEVMRHGGGIVAVYNESLILGAMERAGYDPVKARSFANDGCWEVQIPGETCFAYMPIDALQVLNETLGLTGDKPAPEYPDFESLYAAFLAGLDRAIHARRKETITDTFLPCSDPASGSITWRRQAPTPCSLISIFVDGCIEKARSYHDLGPNYTVRSPHIGGAPDAGNSLYAIDTVVYREKRMTLQEMIEALRTNWEGRELQRLYLRNKLTYYGNDHDAADAYTVRVLNDFADLTHACRGDAPVLFVPGVSTFGRQIEWLPQRMATAFGAKKGEILSGNSSPTPGTDLRGATAIIRSYCKADLARQTTGAALDIKLYPDTVYGENGVQALIALMKGFMELGGYFMQLDVIDESILRAAQENPAAFKTLSVRVSGWNARFVTLDREWQNMIIERTAQHV